MCLDYRGVSFPLCGDTLFDQSTGFVSWECNEDKTLHFSVIVHVYVCFHISVRCAFNVIAADSLPCWALCVYVCRGNVPLNALF